MGERLPHPYSSIPYQRTHRIGTKQVAAIEETEFDHERQSYDDAAELLYQLRCRCHRAAGGQQVIDQEHPCARLNGILVNLEPIGAIFEAVFDLDDGGWKFAGFSDRDESRA